MTKKSDGKATKKNGNETAAKTDGQGAARKLLLARVAGDVASGVVGAPSPSVASAAEIAEVAVDVAEEILKRVGL